MLHRDLTPMNVFVCDERRLKLGDFGIVRQQSDQRGITARTMNAMTAPSELLGPLGAEVAGARRRLSGGAAAGDDRERRCRLTHPGRPTCAR
jgi:serine/threonine protein kinase